MDTVSNSEVLRRKDNGREIWKAIVKREVKMIGQNLKYLKMVSLILEGMIEGKN